MADKPLSPKLLEVKNDLVELLRKMKENCQAAIDGRFDEIDTDSLMQESEAIKKKLEGAGSDV